MELHHQAEQSVMLL